MTFNGFISYSHAADGRLAPAVQRGLHRLAKPWHRRRALWIFRDQTGLAVTPGLWSSIQTALDGSEYFVLLASPEAAQSRWVNREIEHWITTKSANRILPVVTDGEWAWDQERHDFTEDSTAVPDALRGVFAEEPLFLDLRWARGSEHLSLQHSRFRDAIAQLAAPMHGVSKDELEGEDVRHHRRARRLGSGALAMLVVLTLLAMLTSVSSVRNAERATAAAAEALRQQEVAEVQRGSAERFEQEATRQQKVAKEQQALAAAAATEAQRSEQSAQEKQWLADQATAEARRQQRIADQAADRTKELQRLSEEASERTQQLEQEAQKLEAEARRLTKIAEEKQREAKEAAAEAARQQAKADLQQRIAVSRRLTTQGKATIGSDPKTALMLGAAAQELVPDAATLSEVTGVVTATNYAGTISDVTEAVYAPDGVLVAIGTDGKVSLWNTTDRTNPTRITTLSEPVADYSSLALSPDGRTLATINQENTAVLWDVTDRPHPVRLATADPAGAVQTVAFSGDGITLATGDGRGITTLWDVTDRSQPQELAAMGEYVPYTAERLAFSPDGTTLVVDKVRFVAIYDLSDRADPVYLRGLPGFEITSMTFDRTGSTLAAGHYSGYVDLYNMRRTATVEVEVDEQDEQDEVTPPPPLPPDDPDSEPYAHIGGLAGSVDAIAYSADGRYLAAGDGQGMALVWDMTYVEGPGAVVTVRANGAINSVSLSPDAETLVTTDSSDTAILWNVKPIGTPDPLASLTVPGGQITAAAIRPDGRSLVAAGPDGTARSWDVTDPARPVQGADLSIRSAAVRSVAFSPDGRTAAAIGSQDGQLTLTDVTRPDQPVALPGTTEAINGTNPMAFSPDGRTLAVIAGPTRLLLWNVADRTRPALLATLSGGAFGSTVAFSPDGHTLATSGRERGLTLWDVTDRTTPVQLGTLAGHNGQVTTMAFSPDGHTVATGGADTLALLWDITDRARPLRLATLTSHSDTVVTMAFSPDGRTLATGDKDSELFLWDTANPAGPIRLVSLRGLGGQAKAVMFQRDGRTLAVAAETTSRGATVKLWDYTKLNKLRADPAAYACVITGRGLGADEWARYIPEIPYRRTCAG
ncbi:TIR domain-containing protein [Actinoplanes sp. NPDC026670]|uniref:TIR domain-containing protein n=1 Tax=Actinoplanes sp. NPDC026670 TaxID=3154700 RepID=UPI0033C8AF5B